MAGLLATSGRVEPCEELTEEFVELLLSVGRQVSPYRWWVGRLQARGGVGRRVVSDMRLLR